METLLTRTREIATFQFIAQSHEMLPHPINIKQGDVIFPRHLLRNISRMGVKGVIAWTQRKLFHRMTSPPLTRSYRRETTTTCNMLNMCTYYNVNNLQGKFVFKKHVFSFKNTYWKINSSSTHLKVCFSPYREANSLLSSIENIKLLITQV